MTEHTHGQSHGHGSAEEDDQVYDMAFWDERYRSSPTIWSGRPNPQLVAEVAGLAPGRALDLGCGEGADAVWLAGQGWEVTALDLSQVALDRAAALAEQLAGAEVANRITWVQADLSVGTGMPAAAKGPYDLVSAQFFHLLDPPPDVLHRRLASFVAPGGTLLLVGHHPADLATGAAPRLAAKVLYTAEDAATVLDADEWTVVSQDARTRRVDTPDGPVTRTDAVLRAQRSAV